MNETFAIGIDVGATNTKIGVVDAVGQILDHQTIPSDLKTQDPAPFLARIESIASNYMQAHPIKGIGVGLCSLINEQRTGAFLAVNAPALNGLDLKGTIEGIFNCPVQVMNDVAAYALAEYYLGSGRGCRRLLCLGLGTGLAIAVIKDGQVLETWGGVPADAARVILEPDADVSCQGGVRGSAEALCGTAAIERLARVRYGREDLTAHEVIATAREGKDLLSCQVMVEIGAHVGHLLAILSPIFFPQRILVTGGTAEAGEPLMKAVRGSYQSLIGSYMAELACLESGVLRSVEILKGSLGPDAAIVGTTLSFFNLEDRVGE